MGVIDDIMLKRRWVYTRGLQHWGDKLGISHGCGWIMVVVGRQCLTSVLCINPLGHLDFPLTWLNQEVKKIKQIRIGKDVDIMKGICNWEIPDIYYTVCFCTRLLLSSVLCLCLQRTSWMRCRGWRWTAWTTVLMEGPAWPRRAPGIISKIKLARGLDRR